jgi:dTDP-4-dehydrorhamnose reductase
MSEKLRILITGSNGLLGQKLVYALKGDPEVSLIATGRGANRLAVQVGYTYSSLDITNKQEVIRALQEHQPDVVIHTAAMTNVDQCETERDACRLQNVEAVRHLVDAIEGMPHKRVHLIHLSTDFIFDGEAGPYQEEDAPNPVSFYGWSKYDAERIITASGIDWAILRTIIVYGITDNMSRSNIVLWAREALRKGQPMKVVNDQFRSPTLAEDLAQGCILAAKQRARGIFHISGPDTLSIIDLVSAVARVNGLSMDCVEAVSSATLNQAAKRPPRTGFIIDKARRVLGYAPHTFEEGILWVQEQADAYEQANLKP